MLPLSGALLERIGSLLVAEVMSGCCEIGKNRVDGDEGGKVAQAVLGRGLRLLGLVPGVKARQ